MVATALLADSGLTQRLTHALPSTWHPGPGPWVQRARRYVSEQKRLTRDSALNAYLEKYLTSADEFLSQNN